MVSTSPKVVLAGHPFAPIGRGEDLRCTYRALRSIGVRPKVLDIYSLQAPEDGVLQAHLRDDLCHEPGRVNIFHINGDEVPQVMRHLSALDFSNSYNIVYPAWELARYPEEWASHLDRFDEIWAPTRFIEAALAPVVKKRLVRVPLACEVILDGMFSRRYFGIPESAYAFLFSFDFRSYVTRKNPEAVVASFEHLVRKLPTTDTVLVVKMHGEQEAGARGESLIRRLQELGPRVVVINRTMSDAEMRNLIRVCDCFVSLHRSEGFGRGLAEAMYMEKPVIGTAYSGNTDFMSSDDSLPVDYRLVDLGSGDYPFWENQQWADADIEQAADYMCQLAQNPSWGRAIGRKAAIAIRRRVGFRPCGLNYWQQIQPLI
jgi:glycosyltransferase involved in cell wall biosynthesis